MVGDQTANMYIAHGSLLPGEDKIKCMITLVRGLSDVLYEAVALCQLRQLYSVCVIMYVDVYIKVATDQYWALIDCQLVKNCRQFVKKRRQLCLTAGSVNAE